LTLIIWLSSFAFFYVSFGLLDITPSWALAFAIGVIVALAVAAPSAPGFIGVYQAACLAGFSLFGLEESTAVAYSIITHLLQYFLFVAYGAYVLSRSGIKLGQLRRPAATPSS
jgi:uncharacterized membrane protein YbhN (UPF0104 family)